MTSHKHVWGIVEEDKAGTRTAICAICFNEQEFRQGRLLTRTERGDLYGDRPDWDDPYSQPRRRR